MGAYPMQCSILAMLLTFQIAFLSTAFALKHNLRASGLHEYQLQDETQAKRLAVPARRHMLQSNVLSPTCLYSTVIGCATNPASRVVQVEPVEPSTQGGRFLAYASSVAANCSLLSSEKQCSGAYPCSWSGLSNTCTVTESQVQSLAEVSLMCPLAPASTQAKCSATNGVKEKCAGQAGCVWTDAGCIVIAMGGESLDKQYAFLKKFHSYDKQVWGSCEGTDVLNAIASSCNHWDPKECEAESSCSWGPDRSPISSSPQVCQLKYTAVVERVAGDAAFAKSYNAGSDVCNGKATKETCTAAGSVTLGQQPLSPNESKFGRIVRQADAPSVLPSYKGNTSLAMVRELKFAGFGNGSTEAQCLPANTQGVSPYKDCLQMRVHIGTPANKDGSRPFELVPAAGGSQLGCPCVFKLQGSIDFNGGGAKLQYAKNEPLEVVKLDATVLASASLKGNCTAKLSQPKDAQNVSIAYQVPGHSVDISAATGSGYNVARQGDFVSLADSTGCVLQFQVTEVGVPSELSQQPQPAVPKVDIPKVDVPKVDLPGASGTAPEQPGPAATSSVDDEEEAPSSSLTDVKLMSYTGLRVGKEDNCLPVNVHGLSPYAGCLHLRQQVLPAGTDGKQGLQLLPDQGLSSQYQCPCIFQYNGFMLADGKTAMVNISRMDWPNWNVSDFVQSRLNIGDDCSASTASTAKDKIFSLSFNATGEYQVTVPTAITASLQREGDVVTMHQSDGCVLEFQINQEGNSDGMAGPGGGDVIGPSDGTDLESVNLLYFNQLSEGEEKQCMPVNSEGLSLYQDCLRWRVKLDGANVELLPAGSTSESGCPCLLKMNGKMEGHSAVVTFEEMDWGNMWDVSSYISQVDDRAQECSVALKYANSDTPTVALLLSDNGTYSVAIKQPADTFTLSREQDLVTMSGSGCVYLFKAASEGSMVMDIYDDIMQMGDQGQDTPHETVPGQQGGGYEDYAESNDDLDDPEDEDSVASQPGDEGGMVFNSNLDTVLQMMFSGVLNGTVAQCLPVDKLGVSPYQDCYNLNYKIEGNSIKLTPRWSTSEFDCPCVFYLAGTISETDRTSATLSYTPFSWNGQWDVLTYMANNATRQKTCPATYHPPKPSQWMDISFEAKDPGYQVVLTSAAQPQYSMKRTGPSVVLTDTQGCQLAFLVTKEAPSAPYAGQGEGTYDPSAPATGSSSSSTYLPPSSGTNSKPRSTAEAHQAHQARQGHMGAGAIAGIVIAVLVAAVVVAAGVMFSYRRLGFSNRAQGYSSWGGSSYDTLDSAELTSLSGNGYGPPRPL